MLAHQFAQGQQFLLPCFPEIIGIASMRQRKLRIRYGPAGIHVFERASGLNILLDEVQAPTSEWAAAPRQVSIALTNACDLACPHCYAPKTRGMLEFDLLIGWLALC
jgi:hypothetical protein